MPKREPLKNQSPEEREKRLAKGREVAAQERKNLTDEQRKQRSANEKARLQKQSAEEREKRNAKVRERARNLTPEEKKRRSE
ncbi:hypothetical protein CDV36_009913 [Fusarium kuroshium]|uniref:Uncharacterized protein n=2 Tax=Fusarium solani species complex TaxID=232080 RepID=A0A3M2RYT3_9HYPO|nr:hypothetical protein CDV36_009913 [Fusarium kuroshium]RSL90734.1 hypothetical protein CEP51_000582 [Fusarium floridanum]